MLPQDWRGLNRAAYFAQKLLAAAGLQDTRAREIALRAIRIREAILDAGIRLPVMRDPAKEPADIDGHAMGT
jgi:hypothetical protein